MSWIYVLHFETKLAHAQHYIGCTEKLRQRLVAHATGAGSRICRELMRQGIHWKLGGLMECSHRRMRSLERHLKDQKHSSRYCEMCNKTPYLFRGCRSYPIQGINFPVDSRQISIECAPLTGQTVRLTDENEKPTTMQAILAMMKKDKDALGFIPAGGTEGLQTLVAKKRIAIAEVNDEIIGYAAHTINVATTRVIIHQCCVRDDARLHGLGTMMVERIQAEYPDLPLIAKVRDDLAANHFWSAIGFNHTGRVIHPTSKSLINHYLRDPNKETVEWLLTKAREIGPTNLTTKESESLLPTSMPESPKKPG